MSRAQFVTLLWVACAGAIFAERASVQAEAADGATVQSAAPDPNAACRHFPNKRCVLALALAEADTLEKDGFTSSLFSKIALAQAEAGDAEGALATVDKLGDIAEQPKIFDAVLHAQLASGDITAVLAAAARIERVWPRISAYEKIAEACAAANRPGLAKQALRAAIADLEIEVVPSEREQPAMRVAETAAAIGDYDSAREAVDLALASAETPAMLGHGTELWADAAAVRATVGDWAEARATIAAIADGDLRDSAAARVAAALARAGAVAEALAMSQSIRDHRARASAFAWVAHALNAAGDRPAARDAIGQAWSVATQVADPAKRVETLIQIADPRPAPTNLHELVRDPEFAVRIFGLDLDVAIITDDSTLSPAPVNSELARDALRAAFDLALETHDPATRRSLLLRIAELQIDLGDLAAAAKTAERIDERFKNAVTQSQATAELRREGPITPLDGATGSGDRTFTKIAKAHGRTGNTESMLSTLDMISEPTIRVREAALLAKFFATKGETALAQALLQSAHASSEQIEGRIWRAFALTDIADTEAATGDSVSAVSTAQSIKDDRHRMEALLRIAPTLAATLSLQSAQGIENVFVRALTLAALAKRKLAMDDKEGARQAIIAALSVQDAIDDAKQRAVALRRVIDVQISIGDVDGLRNSVDSALVALGKSNDPLADMAANAAFAEAYANSGNYVAALKLVESMDHGAARAKTLVRIADTLPN